ncbi:MAG: hypothetical protein JNM25_04300 [Planctomycetes bacterium]|nr:hypothetical protein [Planctomycetota bacterium]
MNRSLFTGLSALFLVACSGTGKVTQAAPVTAAQTDAEAKFELGRPV